MVNLNAERQHGKADGRRTGIDRLHASEKDDQILSEKGGIPWEIKGGKRTKTKRKNRKPPNRKKRKKRNSSDAFFNGGGGLRMGEAHT